MGPEGTEGTQTRKGLWVRGGRGAAGGGRMEEKGTTEDEMVGWHHRPSRVLPFGGCSMLSHAPQGQGWEVGNKINLWLFLLLL